MSGVVIETDRLRLRVPTAADRDVLCAWFGDPHVMADLAPAMDDAGIEATIARHDSYRGEGIGFWIVERKTDGAAVGFCGLKRCNPGTPLDGQLEIGWILGPDYWGEGYAREAAAASIDWAWLHLPDDRIVAITSRVNRKSQTLMERIGMHAEPALDYLSPSFTEGDRLRDTVVFVISRPT